MMSDSDKAQQQWITHYSAGGVSMEETDFGYGTVFIVADDYPSSCVLKIIPDREPGQERYIHVVVALEFSDDRPGELADYTFRPEDRQFLLEPENLTISDAGLLSAMARQRTTSRFQLQMGWTLQLPATFVAPLRQAIAMATKLLPSKAHMPASRQ